MAKKKAKEEIVEEMELEPEPETVVEEKLDEDIEIGHHAGNPMRIIRDKDGNFVKMVSL